MSDAASIVIVVPVYNACDDLRACVDSVRRATPAGSFRLLLLDDASPQPAIAEYFAELSRERPAGIELLRNETNLGFVATANRGMARYPDRDVLLLNSDTLVTSGWLERILRCADSDPNIGTITPFSNNAEICSFPHFCRDNILADLPPIEQIAKVLAQRPPSYPEIPTAVGFCMYIRRRLLDMVGDFDVDTFGKGYGEENDFCMRTSAAGFRNVICDDAFVAHTGGRSFDARKQALMQENGRRLLARYPHYDRLVQDFVAADPLREIRDLAWQRLHEASTEQALPVASRPPFWRRWFTGRR